jgi:hypothetical protein
MALLNRLSFAGLECENLDGRIILFNVKLGCAEQNSMATRQNLRPVV